MRKQTIGTFIVSAVLLTTATISPVSATAKPKNPSTSSTSPADTSVRDRNIHTMNVGTIHPELAKQLRTKKAGSVKFWEAVAWCETNHNWENGGYFAGGLGMAQSVWQNYGGRQFASRSSKATKEEQIIVANRVAFFGFQTKGVYLNLEDKANKKPFFRPAVGWRNLTKWGKGCVNWKTRKPLRDRYTEAGRAEWNKSRSSARKSSSAGLQGGVVSAQSVGAKRCPQWESALKAHGLVPVARFSYIMWRESRCQEKVVSKRNSNGTRDYGLLQINSSWRTVTREVCGGQSMNVLLKSKCNLTVAKYLFDNGGFNHWSATSGKN